MLPIVRQEIESVVDSRQAGSAGGGKRSATPSFQLGCGLAALCLGASVVRLLGVRCGYTENPSPKGEGLVKSTPGGSGVEALGLALDEAAPRSSFSLTSVAPRPRRLRR
jgi:hypothetical protein